MGEENQDLPPEAYTLLTHDEAKHRSPTKSVKINLDITFPSENGNFNPFVDRKIDNPTTDWQTFSHLLKSTLGSGIMAMPCAFKSAGIIGGILGGIMIAAVCTHTSYILVNCAHILYFKTKKSKMDYPEIAETAFVTGPARVQKFTKIAKYIVEIGIFTTYFGACSTDNLIIATNYGQVIRYYTSVSAGNATIAEQLAMAPVDNSLMQIIMGCLIPPLILLVWVPDLKYLAPISTLANVFMVVVLSITFYYVFQNPLALSELSLTRPIVEFPQFFAITLFAMENIGVIMPLENSMKTPQNFLGTCGVLNKGMFGVTFIYLLLGVFGYARYGDDVRTIITENLPVQDVAAQLVKLLIGSTVLFTFGLQFYVCHEMAWNRVKKFFPGRPRLANYILRAFLVIICVSIAIAIPKIAPLVQLVGAVGFSILGIIIPVVIETITYLEIGYGRFNWRLFKNACLMIIGILAIIFGGYDAIKGIIKS